MSALYFWHRLVQDGKNAKFRAISIHTITEQLSWNLELLLTGLHGSIVGPELDRIVRGASDLLLARDQLVPAPVDSSTS